MEQNNSFVENREVRIFISSTFSDMNGNRDEIINKLIPYLRNRYENQNIVINAIDLRWGITDDDVLKGNVMDICFREIDKCRPFFIGIIGNRYGSSIPLSQLQDNPKTKVFYEIIKDNYSAYDLSATELEMQYAVLQKISSHRMDSFFLIKDEKSPKWSIKEIIRRIRGKKDDEAWKIGNLINRINDSKDSDIKTYQYNDFSSTLITLKEDISTIIDSYFKNESWTVSNVILSHQHSQTRKLFSIKYPKNEDYEYLNHFVSRSEKNILAIYSDDERGNILLANWIERNKNDFKIISYFPISSHNHKNAYTPGEFIYKILSEGSNSYKDNIPQRPDEKLKIWELVESSIQNYINHNRMILIFPNIDDTDYLEHYLLTLVNNLKRRIDKKALKIVVSYREASKIERLLNDDLVELRNISCFTKEEKKQIIASYLQIYGKQNGLTEEQYDSISSLNIPITGMVSVLDYLVTHCTYDNIKNDVNEIVHHIKSQHNIYNYVLDKMEASLTPLEKDSYKKALSFICLSYNGMSETVLEDFCDNLTILDIIKIENLFSFQLIHFQGKITLLNRDLITCIKKRYVDGKENEFRETIVNLFKGKSFYSAYDELLFQYTMLRDEERLYHLIAKNKKAVMYFIENRPLDYAEAWDTLWTKNKEKYSSTTLSDTFSSLTNDKEEIACNHLSYFLGDYCSDYNTAHLLAQKCSNYIAHKEGHMVLYPIALFTEAQILRSEGTITSIKKAIDKTTEAIKEFENGMILLKSLNNERLNNIIEKRMAEMKDMHSQMCQDINCLSKDCTLNIELNKATKIHNKATYLFTFSRNPSIVLPLYRESLGIREKSHANPSDLSESYSQIGYCNYILGDYYSAIRFLEQSSKLISESKGEYHYSLRGIYMFLSFCHQQTGSLNKASEYMKKIADVELHSQEPNQEFINSTKEIIRANDSFRDTLKKAKDLLESKLSLGEESGNETISKAVGLINRYLNN